VEQIWTQRADAVLKLMEKVSPTNDAEREFQRSVWGLCQQLKDAEARSDGGQFVPEPLF